MTAQTDLSQRFLEALADASAAHAIMLRDLAIIDDGYLASILGSIEQARGAELPRMALALVAPLFDERIDSQTAPGAVWESIRSSNNGATSASAMRGNSAPRACSIEPRIEAR